jgi:mannose-6-phosphate isomerase-like protein (cupin superfamily)
MKTYFERRPWGNFEQFVHNAKCSVKIITVAPNSELSLQYHNKRSEFWRILDGAGFVVIGDSRFNVKKGDEFDIPALTVHRVGTGDSELRLLEISFGDFDEADIVRLEDRYDRKV